MPENVETIAAKRTRKDMQRNSTENVIEDNKVGLEEDQQEQNQDYDQDQNQDLPVIVSTTPPTGAIATTLSKSSTVNRSTTGNSTNSTSAIISGKKLNFKKNHRFSYLENGGKKFVWKSLKQIITQEEKQFMAPSNETGGAIECFNYASLNAPPSLKPAKKYSDLSGLEAFYTDPQTKLHFHNAEEFRIIRTLASDIIQGYLALRGATNIVG